MEELYAPPMASGARRWIAPFLRALPDVEMEIVELDRRGSGRSSGASAARPPISADGAAATHRTALRASQRGLHLPRPRRPDHRGVGHRGQPLRASGSSDSRPAEPTAKTILDTTTRYQRRRGVHPKKPSMPSQHGPGDASEGVEECRRWRQRSLPVKGCSSIQTTSSPTASTRWSRNGTTGRLAPHEVVEGHHASRRPRKKVKATLSLQRSRRGGARSNCRR